MGAYEDFLEKYGKGERQQTYQNPTGNTGIGAQPPSSYDEFLSKYSGQTDRRQEAQPARTNPARPQRPQGTEAPSAVPEEKPAQPVSQRPTRPVPLQNQGDRLARVQDETAQTNVQAPERNWRADPVGYLLGKAKEQKDQTEQKPAYTGLEEAQRGRELPGGRHMETIDSGRLTPKSEAAPHLGQFADRQAAFFRQDQEQYEDPESAYLQNRTDYAALENEIETLEAEIPNLEEQLRQGQFGADTQAWEQELERKRAQLEESRRHLAEARLAQDRAFRSMSPEDQEHYSRNFFQKVWSGVKAGGKNAVAFFGKTGYGALNFLFGRDGVVNNLTGGMLYDFADQILGEGTDPFGDWNARANVTANRLNAEAAHDTRNDKAAEIASKITNNVAIMAPYAALMAVSGGTAAPALASTQGLEYAAAVGSASSATELAGLYMSQTVRLLAANPAAQYTYITQFADSAVTAREEGADPLEALLYATVNAGVNTVIEMSGGYEGNGALGWAALKPRELVRTMLEETGEEEAQGFYERLLKSLYKPVEIYSNTNPDALINPNTALETAVDTIIATPFISLEMVGLKQGFGRVAAWVGAREQRQADQIIESMEEAGARDEASANPESQAELIRAIEEISGNKALSRVFNKMFKTTPEVALQELRAAEAEVQPTQSEQPEVSEATPYTAVDALTGVNPTASAEVSEEESPARDDRGAPLHLSSYGFASGDAIDPNEARTVELPSFTKEPVTSAQSRLARIFNEAGGTSGQLSAADALNLVGKIRNSPSLEAAFVELTGMQLDDYRASIGQSPQNDAGAQIAPAGQMTPAPQAEAPVQAPAQLNSENNAVESGEQGFSDYLYGWGEDERGDYLGRDLEEWPSHDAELARRLADQQKEAVQGRQANTGVDFLLGDQYNPSRGQQVRYGSDLSRDAYIEQAKRDDVYSGEDWYDDVIDTAIRQIREDPRNAGRIADGQGEWASYSPAQRAEILRDATGRDYYVSGKEVVRGKYKVESDTDQQSERFYEQELRDANIKPISKAETQEANEAHNAIDKRHSDSDAPRAKKSNVDGYTQEELSIRARQRNAERHRRAYEAWLTTNNIDMGQLPLRGGLLGEPRIDSRSIVMQSVMRDADLLADLVNGTGRFKGFSASSRLDMLRSIYPDANWQFDGKTNTISLPGAEYTSRTTGKTKNFDAYTAMHPLNPSAIPQSAAKSERAFEWKLDETKQKKTVTGEKARNGGFSVATKKSKGQGGRGPSGTQRRIGRDALAGEVDRRRVDNWRRNRGHADDASASGKNGRGTQANQRGNEQPGLSAAPLLTDSELAEWKNGIAYGENSGMKYVGTLTESMARANALLNKFGFPCTHADASESNGTVGGWTGTNCIFLAWGKGATVRNHVVVHELVHALAATRLGSKGSATKLFLDALKLSTVDPSIIKNIGKAYRSRYQEKYAQSWFGNNFSELSKDQKRYVEEHVGAEIFGDLLAEHYSDTFKDAGLTMLQFDALHKACLDVAVESKLLSPEERGWIEDFLAKPLQDDYRKELIQEKNDLRAKRQQYEESHQESEYEKVAKAKKNPNEYTYTPGSQGSPKLRAGINENVKLEGSVSTSQMDVDKAAQDRWYKEHPNSEGAAWRVRQGFSDYEESDADGKAFLNKLDEDYEAYMANGGKMPLEVDADVERASNANTPDEVNSLLDDEARRSLDKNRRKLESKQRGDYRLGPKAAAKLDAEAHANSPVIDPYDNGGIDIEFEEFEYDDEPAPSTAGVKTPERQAPTRAVSQGETVPASSAEYINQTRLTKEDFERREAERYGEQDAYNAEKAADEEQFREEASNADEYEAHRAAEEQQRIDAEDLAAAKKAYGEKNHEKMVKTAEKLNKLVGSSRLQSSGISGYYDAYGQWHAGVKGDVREAFSYNEGGEHIEAFAKTFDAFTKGKATFAEVADAYHEMNRAPNERTGGYFYDDAFGKTMDDLKAMYNEGKVINKDGSLNQKFASQVEELSKRIAYRFELKQNELKTREELAKPFAVDQEVLRGRRAALKVLLEGANRFQLRPSTAFRRMADYDSKTGKAYYELARLTETSVRNYINTFQTAQDYMQGLTQHKDWEAFSRGKLKVDNVIPGLHYKGGKISLNAALSFLKMLETEGATDHIISSGKVQAPYSEEESYSGMNNKGFGSTDNYAKVFDPLSKETRASLNEAKRKGDDFALDEATARAEHELRTLKNNLRAQIESTEIGKMAYDVSFDPLYFLKLALNKTSRAVWGTNVAEQNKFYWPLETMKKGGVELLNAPTIGLDTNSIVQSRTGESGGLVLRPFTEVMQGYIRTASHWAAYEELSDKLHTLSQAYTGTESITDLLSDKLGTGWATWLKNYEDDLNGKRGKERSFANRLFGSLRSNVAQSSLLLNGSVALKQAPSGLDFMGFLDADIVAKHFLALPFRSAKSFGKNALIQELEGGTRMLANRRMGYNLVETGEKMESGRGNAAQRLVGKVPGWMSNWITKTDYRTVANGMLACADQVDRWIKNGKDGYANLKKGTDDYDQAVIELFENAVINTQPIYNKEFRADAMRTDNEILRSLTMFRTQQTQNYNNLVESIGELQALKRSGGSAAEIAAARKRVVGTIAGQVSSAFMFALLDGVAKLLLPNKWHLFRDDEDEFSWGLFGARGGYSFLNSLVSTSWLGSMVGPFALDQITKFANKRSGGKIPESGLYYGTEESALGLINSAYEAFDAFTDKPGLSTGTALAYSLAAVFGIPLKNAHNLVNAVVMYGLQVPGLRGIDYEHSDDYIRLLDRYFSAKPADKGRQTMRRALTMIDKGSDKMADLLLGTLNSSDERIVEAAKKELTNSFVTGAIDSATYRRILRNYFDMDTRDIDKLIGAGNEKREFDEAVERAEQRHEGAEATFKKIGALNSKTDPSYEMRFDLISNVSASDKDTDLFVNRYMPKKYRDAYKALRGSGLSPDRANAIIQAIDTDTTEDHDFGFSQAELYEYGRQSESNRRSAQRIWNISGFKKTWNEYDEEYRKNPVNILVSYGADSKYADRMWKGVDANKSGGIDQKELYSFYKSHPELEGAVREIWANKGWGTSFDDYAKKHG